MAEDNRSPIEHPRLNLEGVLAKLPLPSLLACCCVSKSLLNLIKNDSEFARMHLSRSVPRLMIQCRFDPRLHLIDLDTDTASRVEIKANFNVPSVGFRIADSCNGLILLDRIRVLDGGHRCMLYNPVTFEYTLLPQTVTPYDCVTCAFYYCPKTHKFEVFCVFNQLKPLADVSSHSAKELNPSLDSVSASDSDPAMECTDYSPEYTESGSFGGIYVKGSDSWESLGTLPFSPEALFHPCHLDKTVHWICADNDINVPNVIAFFNFETHEFGDIPGPDHIGKTHAYSVNDLILVVLGNRLSIFDRFTNVTKFSVWVMKEYGVKDSWSREYAIDITDWDVYGVRRRLTPVTCRNNGEVVMVSYSFILFYDLIKKKGRVVKYPPLTRQWCTVMMHTPSLISLGDVLRGTNLEVVKVGERRACRELIPQFIPRADPDLTFIPNNYLELYSTFSDEV